MKRLKEFPVKLMLISLTNIKKENDLLSKRYEEAKKEKNEKIPLLIEEKGKLQRGIDLEKEIEKASQTQIKDFDKSKELVGKYLSTDYSSSTIDNYRRKLKKI